MLAMKRRVSTRSLDIAAVGMRADMAAATARAQSGLRDSSCAIRITGSGLSERRDKARVAPYLVCNLLSDSEALELRRAKLKEGF
jgi:hypothetical protein